MVKPHPHCTQGLTSDHPGDSPADGRPELSIEKFTLLDILVIYPQLYIIIYPQFGTFKIFITKRRRKRGNFVNSVSRI